MGTFQRFEDIDSWQKARSLTQEIYEVTKTESFARDFALRDQIRRASASIMSNIAEGFERGGNKEFIQFLYVAKGSASEVRSHLYAALDQGYIHQEAFDKLYALAMEISKMLASLSTYLSQSGIKGYKYK